MNVAIQILGGPYAGAPTWIGKLADAPVTVILPEGTVTARTTEAAAKLRADVAAFLAPPDRMRVEIGAVHWAVLVVKLPEGA